MDRLKGLKELGLLSKLCLGEAPWAYLAPMCRVSMSGAVQIDAASIPHIGPHKKCSP